MTTLAITFSGTWSYPFLHNPAYKWLALLGVLLGAFVAGRLASALLARQGKRLAARERAEALRVLFESAGKPTQLAVLAIGLWFAQTFLVLDIVKDAVNGTFETVHDGPIREFWVRLAKAIGATALAWFVFRLVSVLEHFLKKWTSRTNTKLDDQLVPLLRKSLRVFILIIAALFIAKNIFNMDVSSLLAGLGLGGLAFALAAKDSLANLFGSIVIFADRPFSVGERVKISGQDGAIEEVGFRSTKVRTLAGHLTTIPNSIVANETIENVARRPFIKRVLNVTVTYDTTPEKIRRGIAILREMLDARTESFHPDCPPRVFFSDFNAESLNIVVYYWFAPPEWWDYLAFNHEFNMELLSRFNEEGIEFAFPTQTIHVKPEGKFTARIESTPSGPRVGT